MMKPLALAMQYMETFYSDEAIDALRPILSANLRFDGPFYQFDSAEAYLESLRSDSRAGLTYEIIESFEAGSSACLIYQFSKPGISIPMAQLFETDGDKILRIVLIFDTGAFNSMASN